MLESLSINNIVLIDKLNLTLDKGLCVLTGETGSGKSILLDALGLAIGYRSSSRLLRNGTDQGSVVAEFFIGSNLKCKELLKSHEIDFNDTLILRRVLYSDGRSKAIINDIPVTQTFLAEVGETLLEVHGQSEQRGLLNASFHREILDEYGGLLSQVSIVSEKYDKMKETKDKLKELLEKKDYLLREQDYLRHILNELEALNLKEGEEEELADKRKILMNKEKILTVLDSVRNELEGQKDIGKSISYAQGSLIKSIALGEDIMEDGNNAFQPVIDSLERASIELNEAIVAIDNIYESLGFEQNTLEEVEERLFSIRGMARKFNISTTELIKFTEETREKLKIVENSEVLIGDLGAELELLKKEYLIECERLSNMRKEAGERLAKEVMNELIPLRMERTIFKVEFTPLEETQWGRYGTESLRFIASTNPGSPLDNLSKIASGGELSRFMLALKVVLSKVKSVPTIIFDEIDTGIGGAVADAVGERLKKLGQYLQVLVVTHQPQVASKANYHLRVRKSQQDDTTNTFIDILNQDERIQEVARMLSGDIITDEAVNASKRLLGII